MSRWITALALLTLPAVADAAGPPDPAALAAVIDQATGAKLRAEGIPAAPLADDATFFRRVHLALGGRAPTAGEVRAFLDDTDPAKRAKAIEKLLGSAAFANHLSVAWRSWLMPEATTNPDLANLAPPFDAWLRARIRAGVSFDKITTEILTAPLGTRPTSRGQVLPEDPETDAGVIGFYTAKEGKPENLAAATSRVFLGVQLECAQCHNHPFARWTRDQFWGMAAFFAGIDRSTGALREVPGRRELLIPNTDRAAPATFLDDKSPEWKFKASPRVTLAGWVTAPDNPFFARAVVNRLWGFVFGVGLVDPIDDFHDQNLPSHPELLDALAAAFVASGFDVKFVLRAITLSQTFQRDSTITEPRQADVRLFARFPVQAMTPEQLFDSLAAAIGGPADVNGRRQFLETFAVTTRKTEAPTTILQALTLMNGDLVGRSTTPGSGRTLTAATEFPGLTPAERIETLYLAALGRPPRPDELRKATAFVEKDNPKARYGDLFWVLLNTIEFRTNH